MYIFFHRRLENDKTSNYNSVSLQVLRHESTHASTDPIPLEDRGHLYMAIDNNRMVRVERNDQ